MPPQEDYVKYLDDIWSSSYVTNQGPLLKNLENQLKKYLRVKDFHLVANGTLALQLALRAVGANGGEVITTPFTYVATVSSILWENCTPVFVDIDDSLTMDPAQLEEAITTNTKAILPVHVFGNACDVKAIDKIAAKHKIPVIYDAAHAFGVYYNKKPLVDNGDISTLSFHATKLYHTVEGGGLIIRDGKISKSVELMKRFGHEGDEHQTLGINAKASELHAAMGLANLKHIDRLIEERKRISELYKKLLGGKVETQMLRSGLDYNYAYFPIILKNEKVLKNVEKHLNDESIFPRRYFYPSLDELPYVKNKKICKKSRDISSRILCLPLFVDLPEAVVEQICDIVNKYA